MEPGPSASPDGTQLQVGRGVSRSPASAFQLASLKAQIRDLQNPRETERRLGGEWEVRVPQCPSRAEVLKKISLPTRAARCCFSSSEPSVVGSHPRVLTVDTLGSFFSLGTVVHSPRNSSKGSGRFSAEQDHRRLQKHRDARRKHLEGAALRGGFQGVRDPPRSTPPRPGAGVVQVCIRQEGRGWSQPVPG